MLCVWERQRQHNVKSTGQNTVFCYCVCGYQLVQPLMLVIVEHVCWHTSINWVTMLADVPLLIHLVTRDHKEVRGVPSVYPVLFQNNSPVLLWEQTAWIMSCQIHPEADFLLWWLSFQIFSLIQAIEDSSQPPSALSLVSVKLHASNLIDFTGQIISIMFVLRCACGRGINIRFSVVFKF